MGGSTKQKHDSFTLALTESVIFGGQWDPGYLFLFKLSFCCIIGLKPCRQSHFLFSYEGTGEISSHLSHCQLFTTNTLMQCDRKACREILYKLYNITKYMLKYRFSLVLAGVALATPEIRLATLKDHSFFPKYNWLCAQREAGSQSASSV